MSAFWDFLLAPPESGGRLKREVAPEARRLDRRRRLGTLARGVADAVASTPTRADSEAAVAPSALAILCPSGDARALGVAAAAALARRTRASCGVACIWTGDADARRPPSPLSASRAARRMAATLAARDLDAVPCGQAVAVTLPAEGRDAAAAAQRAAAAAAGRAAVVVAIGGPRDDAFDLLLAEQDGILLVTRPGDHAALPLLAAAGLGPGVANLRSLVVDLSPAGRALAARGLAVPRALRSAVSDEADPR
jgi:hypothetical protein